MGRLVEMVRLAPAQGEPELRSDGRPQEWSSASVRTVVQVLAAGVCYYLATRTAWLLTFPDSKV